MNLSDGTASGRGLARHLSCHDKGIEGEEWEALYCHYRELNQATGAQKPSESEKAKAPLAMKAASDRDEEFYDPARTEDILGRTQTRLELREAHLKDPVAALAKALECLEAANKRWHLVSQIVVVKLLSSQWRSASQVLAKHVVRVLFGKGSGLSWTHGMLWVCARQPASRMFQGKCGPHGELFFFLTKKEPLALTKAVEFRPLVPAETLRACALIGLHLRAAESASASSGSQSHDLGGAWRCGCPKSLDWDRDVESWTESEGTSSSD